MFLIYNPKTLAQLWRDEMETEFNEHKESERLKFSKRYALNHSLSKSSQLSCPTSSSEPREFLL